MKRKTNLFYTNGADSKFLTFSNYTEALTGNFLSTDTKLYPSMFLCLNIKPLYKIGTNIIDENEKEKFIRDYLVGYYENKLAYLRDVCLEGNENPETKLLPLNYLFEAIFKYWDDYNDAQDEINKIDYNKSNIIEYIGDVTEQDYNGTYTDTICILNFDTFYNTLMNFNIEYDINNFNAYSYNYNYLYGWRDEVLDKVNGTSYANTDIHYDIPSSDSYVFESNIKSISIIKPNMISKDNITFNVVIPLFDIANINYTASLYKSENITDVVDTRILPMEFDADNKVINKNIPLGIWFSNDKIELIRDANTGFSQSWSLLISSQFKPFPYSHRMTNQIDDSSNSNAFPTFAMILSKQNAIIDEFIKLTGIINEQGRQIQSLQDQLNQKMTDANIDKIKRDFINYKYEMTNKYNELEQKVKQYMENLTWHATV